MKKTYHIIALFFVVNLAQAQINEFGLWLGGSNFIGDVGSQNYISPNAPAFGILYKWNKSPRFSWRFSAIRTKISANDAASDNPARIQRNLKFDNGLTEFSAGFEFNFFDFNLHESGFKTTPYLATGVNYFLYDNLYLENKKYDTTGNSGSFALPIIAGVKMKISNSLILALEAGARYTFIDDIDGSLPKNQSKNALQFGNTKSNDWYMLTGATITYTFGEKPCYCNN